MNKFVKGGGYVLFISTFLFTHNTFVSMDVGCTLRFICAHYNRLFSFDSFHYEVLYTIQLNKLAVLLGCFNDGAL